MYDNSDPSQKDSSSEQESSSSKAPASSKLLRCAYCGKKFERAASPIMPFCSIRCHRVDLGMWLNESYGLPYEGERTPDVYIEEEE